ncbi:hypothetical protein [Streptomyces mexicanus]|uniref:hypothetical protein n=1 Tax=Streptomyces mexicanus TaxID=178566 RepID=UPI0031E8601E
MPADEVTHGADADRSRARTGARHAAPRKPLFTRFHMPAGRAIAMAAMPTAVIVGMGFTSSLALADNNTPAPSAKSLTADEYKDCVAALGDGKDTSTASPAPSASASADDSAENGKDGKDVSSGPTPSATASTDRPGQSGTGDRTDDAATDDASSDKASGDSSADKASSSDSGADDKAVAPTASATPSPSATASQGGGLLGGLGDALGDLLGGGKDTDAQATPSASATPSAGATGSVTGTVKDTTEKVTGTVDKTVQDTTDTASKAAGDVTGTVKDTTGKLKDTTDKLKDTAEDAAGAATGSASPSPSASSSTDPENCPKATDAQGGVDNTVPLADDPWYLDASSLLLKGAEYKGVVEVKTASGTVKKVLKYVISDGTDIGDLHQTVKDKQAGKTYHVQAAKGSTSTIRGGQTVMYTESISGNLLGLIPVTFSPDSPPPLNIPIIYFTKVHVVQAAQFGGNLHVPGMHLYTTDGTG